jgi:hypothetical protein
MLYRGSIGAITRALALLVMRLAIENLKNPREP